MKNTRKFKGKILNRPIHKIVLNSDKSIIFESQKMVHNKFDMFIMFRI